MAKKAVKKSTTRRRRDRKHVERGQAHIQSTFNNTIVTITDTVGNTLVSASTLEKEVKDAVEKTNNVEAAAHLGTVIAKKALDKGITTVVFDRGGFIYQGKVKALAEAAREAGLEF